MDFVEEREGLLPSSSSVPLLTHGRNAIKWLAFSVLVGVTYTAFFFGLVLTIARIDGEFVGEGSLHIEKSTVQSLQHFWESRVYLPLFLILLFSVIFPVYKFFLIIAILTAKNRQSLDTAIRWSGHLRQTAKFQFLDIFVAIFMRAFLNQDLLHTELKEGFFVYLAFCVLSLITAEVLSVLVHPVREDKIPLVESGFDRLMFLLSAGGLGFGLVWCLFRSILIVKVALRGSLTVSQSSLSLVSILNLLLFNSSNRDPATGEDSLFAWDAVVGGGVIVALGIVLPLLFVLSRVFGLIGRGRMLDMIISDWSLGDVMALGLFTTLISMNSFDNLSAEAPEGLLSGFYFLLMYGLSCFDISSSVHRVDSPPVDGGRAAVLNKVSGSFLIMKSVGWGVFFLVWILGAHVNPVDIDRINTAIRANLPVINSALQGSLPRTAGNCTDPGALNLLPCLGNSPLYYDKGTYEVEARWITGLNTAHMDAIVLSAPVKQKLALTISGAMTDIPMSLSVAECFTPDVYITGHCDRVWDNTDACCGQNKQFNIVVIADCHEEFPFVRNITIQRVNIDRIVISERVIGVHINLSDITDKIQDALVGILEPYVSTKAFINWGKGELLTLGDLINKVIQLNAGGMTADGNFTCPEPIIREFKI
jgi:hypothetical protein